MEKHLLKQIILDQKEEIPEILGKKIIKRDVYPATNEILNSDLIKVIMGVRRCGKSILAHQSMKESYSYVNFDDERLISIKKENLNTLLEVLHEIHPGCKNLLLDEIQNVEGWELFVNRLKRMGYNITVTGSNAKLLSQELATHLTGRHFSIDLYPFSFKEFVTYNDVVIKKNDIYITEKRALINNLFEEYLQLGGFPEIFTLEAKGHYLRELFDKIITRDIVLRHNIRGVADLKEIALYALSNFGSRMTYHKIKNTFEIKSVHTVKNYLNYLQETYLLFQIAPFSFRLKEQIKHPRKMYAIDTGLINALVPRGVFEYGRLMENLVFLELKRRHQEIYFYAQPDYEVDFLIKEGAKIKQLIQVCYSINKEDTKKREVKALLKASDKLKCKKLLVITRDEEGEEKFGSKTVNIIPAWKWLLIK